MSGHDDMDDLKRLLADAPPPAAGASARERAMAAALSAFEEEKAKENLAARQGLQDDGRQTVRQPGLTTRIWRRLMNISLPSTQQLMMGGASLAVLVIAVVAIQDQDRTLNAPRTERLIADGKASGEPTVTQDRLPRSADKVRPAGERTEADDSAAAPLADSAPRPVTAEQGRAAAPPPPTVDGTLKAKRRVVTGDTFSGEPESEYRRLGREMSSGRPVGSLSERGVAAEPKRVVPREDIGRERFPDADPNQVKVVTEDPVSTFSVDVDTASYALVRQSLSQNLLPPKNAVRIEEMINYFPYDYAPPESDETPFNVDVSLMETPWNDRTKLMRIGIKGYEITAAERPKANLVFLIDTSGSMNQQNKLPLLIQSFELLLDTLGAEDTVSIVAYAGSAGTVLEPTKASDKDAILGALHSLGAGGSTAGGEGIRLAYSLAEAHKIEGGVNRVMLATDGDFNVGIRDQEELKGFIERKRETGVFLSVLGFGRGNYNDALMQTLAQNGNGQAAYIDTLNEARKVLVDEATSSLFPIAKDVKIQVEFNPDVVAEYRLIGYETRMLNREDFNNDKIDAAEVGSGHNVTALYELVMKGSGARMVDEPRYGAREETAGETAVESAPTASDARSRELAFVKIRYKDPDADSSKLITRPVTSADEDAPGTDARFAAAVAAFGQILKGGRYTGDYTLDDVIELANGAKGEDPFNYRGEFVQMVRSAKTAKAMQRQ